MFRLKYCISYLNSVERRLEDRSTSASSLSLDDTDSQCPDQSVGIDLHDIGDESNNYNIRNKQEHYKIRHTVIAIRQRQRVKGVESVVPTLVVADLGISFVVLHKLHVSKPKNDGQHAEDFVLLLLGESDNAHSLLLTDKKGARYSLEEAQGDQPHQ